MLKDPPDAIEVLSRVGPCVFHCKVVQAETRPSGGTPARLPTALNKAVLDGCFTRTMWPPQQQGMGNGGQDHSPPSLWAPSMRAQVQPNLSTMSSTSCADYPGCVSRQHMNADSKVTLMAPGTHSSSVGNAGTGLSAAASATTAPNTVTQAAAAANTLAAAGSSVGGTPATTVGTSHVGTLPTVMPDLIAVEPWCAEATVAAVDIGSTGWSRLAVAPAIMSVNALQSLDSAAGSSGFPGVLPSSASSVSSTSGRTANTVAGPAGCAGGSVVVGNTGLGPASAAMGRGAGPDQRELPYEQGVEDMVVVLHSAAQGGSPNQQASFQPWAPSLQQHRHQKVHAV